MKAYNIDNRAEFNDDARHALEKLVASIKGKPNLDAFAISATWDHSGVNPRDSSYVLAAAVVLILELRDKLEDAEIGDGL